MEWFLLTFYPITKPSDSLHVGWWYECRWIIEHFHKRMKTGCNIEELQFTFTERLKPMIALLSVVAVTLLNLRDISRQPEAKVRLATEILSPVYIQVLRGWHYHRVRTELTIHTFCFALTRLGGHQNLKRDHQSGWLVLWRGWAKLQLMVDGDCAILRKQCG